MPNNFNDSIPGDTGLTGGTGAASSTQPAGLFDSLTAPFAFLGVLGRPDFWTRVGIGAIGFFLTVAGIWILVLSNKQVQSAVSDIAETAVKATPQGAATSAVVGAVS